MNLLFLLYYFLSPAGCETRIQLLKEAVPEIQYEGYPWHRTGQPEKIILEVDVDQAHRLCEVVGVMIDALLHPAEWKLPFIRLQYWKNMEVENQCYTFLHLNSLSLNRIITQELAQSPTIRPKLCDKVLPLPSEAQMTKELLRQFAYRTLRNWREEKPIDEHAFLRLRNEAINIFYKNLGRLVYYMGYCSVRDRDYRIETLFELTGPDSLREELMTVTANPKIVEFTTTALQESPEFTTEHIAACAYVQFVEN